MQENANQMHQRTSVQAYTLGLTLVRKCQSKTPEYRTERTEQIPSFKFYLTLEEAALKKPPHPFVFLATACPLLATPRFLESALLEQWLLQTRRWKDRWRSRTLVCICMENRQITGILTEAFISKYLHGGFTDPSWWMITVGLEESGIYLMQLHLMCFTWCTYSFAWWLCELSVLLLRITRKSESKCERSFEFYELIRWQPLKRNQCISWYTKIEDITYTAYLMGDICMMWNIRYKKLW